MFKISFKIIFIKYKLRRFKYTLKHNTISVKITIQANSSLRCDNDKLYNRVSELENMLSDLKRENSNLNRQLKNKDRDINVSSKYYLD